MRSSTNRLQHEKSPYLQQHAHNPVDWYPWGEEALARARAESKPIFLSIGYSTCHWCHVMERESFENADIASLLNERFVCIKVDREERPDLDELYMTAVQMMTGQGGWPMTTILTPEREPFFAGTYFPPDDRYGRPGLRSILTQIDDVWRTKRDEVLTVADEVRRALERHSRATVGDARGPLPGAALLAEGFRECATLFDERDGGFGGAPKFPTPHRLRFLLRYAARAKNEEATRMACRTLDAMACGGMHDHLGGGFHRYATDARWLVPHFEKMLYDQAGLALAYLEGWLVTRKEAYARVTRGILDYVLRDLTHPDGGFYSAEDADSEGEEGRFYVWREEEIRELLGADRADPFCRAYGVVPNGNWEQVNILHTASLESIVDGAFDRDRAALLERRAKRPRPHLDDKIVTAWNGFLIEAMALAGRALEEPRYVAAARRAAAFIETHVRAGSRLARHHRNGPATIKGYLDDYAFMARANLVLYETTFEPSYLGASLALARECVALFSMENGAFRLTGEDSEALLAPVIEIYDGAIPSGNSVAAGMLLRLGHLAGDGGMEERGRLVLRAFAETANRSPSSFAELLCAVDFALGPTAELVVAADARDPVADALWRVADERFLPNLVRAFRPAENARDVDALLPHFRTSVPVDGKATAYFCRDYACALPVHDPAALRSLLDRELERP